MSAALYSFQLAALGAELEFAPATEFSARMATFYCRSLMALEALATAKPSACEAAQAASVGPGMNQALAEDQSS